MLNNRPRFEKKKFLCSLGQTSQKCKKTELSLKFVSMINKVIGILEQ
jgi:hypothetical protein